ncbi:hypothetical protein CEXT_497921 [Caerostris extrusa]|uniref:Secreted protein n=1 Tax=Caerostris extrusa TaxID=172846 RepID=A0AAV4TID8_CAEEX|nr:hypothetical protein CEXT_497921 [Caerostris extrusa]
MSKSHPPVWVVWTLLEASMPANLLTTDARVFFKTAQWGDVKWWNIFWNRFHEGWRGCGSDHFIPQIHAPFTSGAPTSHSPGCH